MFIFAFTAIHRTDVFELVVVCLVALCLVTLGGCLAMSTIFDGPQSLGGGRTIMLDSCGVG